MPVTIHELVIKTTIGENQEAPAQDAPEKSEKDLVQTCVSEVIRILEEQKER